MCTEVTNREAGIITEDTGESTELCREQTPTDPWVLSIVKLTLTSFLISILLSQMNGNFDFNNVNLKTASNNTYIHDIGTYIHADIMEN